MSAENACRMFTRFVYKISGGSQVGALRQWSTQAVFGLKVLVTLIALGSVAGFLHFTSSAEMNSV